MATDASVPLYELLQKDEGTLVQHWVDAQINAPSFRSDRISRQELTDQSRRFMTALREAVRTGESDIMGPAWAGVRQMLDDLSVTRAQHG